MPRNICLVTLRRSVLQIGAHVLAKSLIVAPPRPAWDTRPMYAQVPRVHDGGPSLPHETYTEPLYRTQHEIFP
jgi:hypothetical protein